MAYTLGDFIKLNPNYKKRYDPQTRTAYVSNARTGREISFLEGQGQQYGLGGLQNDSHIINDPNRLVSSLSAPEKPRYTSPYSDRITSTLAAIQNRPAFRYDPSRDEGLQAAQESAADTVSRLAARRGMLYSDSNRSQMGKAALNLIPQFEQAAFNRYSQEGQTLAEQLAMLQNLENTAYGRYRDVVGDVESADEREFDRAMDLRRMGLEEQGQQFSQGMQQQEFAYRQARDSIADERYKAEFDEDTRRFGLNYALDKARLNNQISSDAADRALRGAELQERTRSNKASEAINWAKVQMEMDKVAQQDKDAYTADVNGYIGEIAAGTMTLDIALSDITSRIKAGAMPAEYGKRLQDGLSAAFTQPTLIGPRRE